MIGARGLSSVFHVRWISGLLFSSVLVLSVQARLGENEVACAMRYQHGQDVAPKIGDRMHPLLSGIHTTNKTYQYQGWTIQIGFMRGIAHRMRYRHADSNQRITDDEVKAILAANGGLSSWREADAAQTLDHGMANALKDRLSGTVWERSDGARATLQLLDKVLILDSAAYRRWSERPKPSEKKAIPAF